MILLRYLQIFLSQKEKIYENFLRWQGPILYFFGYDPLKCPACGTVI